MTKKLTHIDETGRASMVDVGQKPDTERVATARGSVKMQPKTLQLIVAGNMKKGDVLTTAQLAGIMAAKQTGNLIPLCHPLILNHIEVICTPNLDTNCIDIEASVRLSGKTGVEMEALTAVSVAALTIYDMAKAVDRHMQITNVRVIRKAGGKSGDWQSES
ncbi:MAG: cyclic pyranopterin monophosphate synthase MoaC [Chloroflexi bacterium]|nr:cyclic pyranopterin monophosphate synthase MoaC [Chloroflexota bacterium]